MFLWSLCALFLLFAGRHSAREFGGNFERGVGERSRISNVISLLQELEETLAAGAVPAPERWDKLRTLHAPWGVLAFESIRELRSAGGTLLPTLRRLRLLAQDQARDLSEGRARAAQALVQALACAGLVPCFGGALYFLLPGVSSRSEAWLFACAVSAALALVAAGWMLRLSEAARWGGLPAAARSWPLAALCAGERFLALLRAGNPADLAWTRSCELLHGIAPRLALDWRFSVWEGSTAPATGAGNLLVEAGGALRKAVHVSVMEGRPCADRVETALQALRQELRAQVERELSLLGVRVLKPLFLCVAPSLIGLLGFGFWLAWQGGGVALVALV